MRVLGKKKGGGSKAPMVVGAVLLGLLMAPVGIVVMVTSIAGGIVSDLFGGGGGDEAGRAPDGSYNVDDSTFVDGGSDSYAWGGHGNGKIPASEMCPIPWASAHEARCDAVEALTKLNAEYRTAFGTDIAITDSYRSYEDQVAVRASWCARGACFMAAVPGTSNHGWGLAFDLGGGINNYGTVQYAWMKTNGGRFGYFHPTWAEPDSPDYRKPEPWHWQFIAVDPAPPAPGPGGVLPGLGLGTPDSNRAIGQQMAAQRGFIGEQWTCLEQLWTRESGWDHRADNPTSSAYGIPQALPGSKMAAAGPDWETNPVTQITWGLDYITGRYTDPCTAWQHSNDVGWY